MSAIICQFVLMNKNGGIDTDNDMEGIDNNTD